MKQLYESQLEISRQYNGILGEGSNIQAKCRNSDRSWFLCTLQPSWAWDIYEYRVKP